MRSEGVNYPPGKAKTGTMLLQLPATPHLRYFLYIPKCGGKNAPVLVSVHGISRNAATHARRFSRLAEHYGIVVVAPLFDKQHFPDYQRLRRHNQRADLALQRVLASVKNLTGADTQKIYLFGHSGGGQFAHRYTMAYPEQVAAVAIGAAGWYTFPDSTLRFPYGTAPHHKLPDLFFNARQFLRVPGYVLVGNQDTTQDQALRNSARVNQQQGMNRTDRGRRWVNAMKRAARQHNLNTEFQFVSLPGAGHSFTECEKAGGITVQALSLLFDERGHKPSPLPTPHSNVAMRRAYP